MSPSSRITITDYQVNPDGTLTFREDALKRKTGVGPVFLRAPYTQVGEIITLRIDELPADLEVSL